MPLIDINLNPSTRHLRQFGFASLIALPGLTWMFTENSAWTGIAACIGVGLLALSWVLPVTVLPAFVGLSLITAPIGIVVGEVVLLLVYIGVFVPISGVMKIIGRDPIHKRPDPNADSYWESREQVDKVSRYYRQF